MQARSTSTKLGMRDSRRRNELAEALLRPGPGEKPGQAARGSVAQARPAPREGRNASRPSVVNNENVPRQPRADGPAFLAEPDKSEPRRPGPALRDLSNEPRAPQSLPQLLPQIAAADSAGRAARAQQAQQVSLTSLPVARPFALPAARSAAFQCGGGSALYAVNTTNGIVRGYNEDRVSIVVNVRRKPEWKPRRWPVCSFFAMFDGHGGTACADFLRDHLHRFVLDHPCFPEDVPRAIALGCEAAEAEFRRLAARPGGDKSGSCALVLLLVDDCAYVGNVGDCRIVASEQRGKAAVALSRDHKPEEKSEQERIVRAGGAVSKSGAANARLLPAHLAARLPELPFRVYPGGLSVSRSFGDFSAKDPAQGGNPGVLIARPDVSVYRLDPQVDFLLIACDGVFDKFTTRKVCEIANRVIEESRDHGSLDKRLRTCERVVDAVILESVRKMSYDNLTVIFLNLNAF